MREGLSRFVKESLIRAAPERVFAFHELPDALARLTPARDRARIIEQARSLRVGERALVRVRVMGLVTVDFVAEHTIYDPPRMFEDVQRKGPFKRWRHRHIVEPHAEGAILRDEIEYEALAGRLGEIFSKFLVERRLRRLFDYRHEVTRRWCESAARD